MGNILLSLDSMYTMHIQEAITIGNGMKMTRRPFTTSPMAAARMHPAMMEQMSPKTMTNTTQCMQEHLNGFRSVWGST